MIGFSREDYLSLHPNQKEAIEALYGVVTRMDISRAQDLDLVEFELFYPAVDSPLPEGVISPDMSDGDILHHIRAKFFYIHQAAAELANREDPFDPLVTVDAEIQEQTIAVVLSRKWRYLALVSTISLASDYQFRSLAQLADQIAAIRSHILYTLLQHT